MNRETPPWLWTLLLVLAIALPWVLRAHGQDYYISMISRMMIYGIAACSLNLILGFGGLVSFGHAAFVGIGAYAVGIMITEGVTSGWLNFAVAMGVSALAAAVIGAISLRTRGVYFIMITLALDLKNDLTFYFVVLLVLVLTLVIISRMMKSRFGRVILAIRDDDTRVDAIGFPAYTYKWILFIIAGTLGGLAGALMVNHQNYVSPNLMHWTQSGTLMVMVILGGVGTLSGGLWGALVLLILEDLIAEYTVHWQFYIGWFLLAVVLLAPRGLSSFFNRGKKLETKGHA